MARKSDVTIRLSAEGRSELVASLRAVGGEGERMARQIERSGVPASRGLLAVNAASRQLQGNMQGLAGRAGLLGASLTALGPIGVAVAAGLGAMALGISRAFSIAKEGMAFGDEIDTAAKRLGVGIEALQEFRTALQIFGDESARFDDGARTLLERLGEAARGKGEGVEIFRRLGIDIRNARGEMKGIEAILPELADAMAGLGGEAARADVANKLFGGQGQNFVTLLQDGSEGLERMRGEMRAAGLVMDAELVRRYAEASDQAEVLTTAIGVHLKSAFADFPNGLNATLTFFEAVSRGLAEIADKIREIENKSTAGLAREIAALEAQLARVDQLGLRGPAARLSGLEDPEVLRRQIAALQAELAARDARPPVTPPPGTGTGGDERDSRAIANAERDAKILEQLALQVGNFGDARQQAIDNALARLSVTASAEQRAEVERLAGSLFDMAQHQKDLNRELDAEIALRKEGETLRRQTLTDNENLAEAQAKYNELLRAAAIDQETYGRAMQAAQEQFDPATRAAKELSGDLARMSIDAISTGRAFSNMGDVAVEALQRILNKMLEMLAFKPLEDAFGSFLSAGFSGVFHGGGEVRAGAPGRAVDPSVFAFAPRMHRGGNIGGSRGGGLAPGERPIIAMDGEKIFTPRQLDNADGIIRALSASAARGGGDVNVIVRPVPGTEAETTRRPNASGGEDIEVVMRQVDDWLGSRIAEGRSQTGEALQRRFGLDRAAGLQR